MIQRSAIKHTLTEATGAAILYEEEFCEPFNPDEAGDWDAAAWSEVAGVLRRDYGCSASDLEILWDVFSVALRMAADAAPTDA